ncbi:hypothetical protein QUH73_13000 [Labilibaculum sp. K2S]|uniref:hypothetical protein n=1 Tax=Labilibaculum sp. K2S TaxID=3056386 RepID=UPI0025A35AC6|nr:hypothetical protein [Labilibaculum sp. K2S]MDM8160738.1 hypothetical protein [Labilibaculum sp. K2S]
MKKHILPILVYSCCFSLSALGSNLNGGQTDSIKRKWYLPRDAKIQYAGNIGFLSAGITYHLAKDWYRLSFMYGSTSMHSHVHTLNTVAIKNTFLIKQFHIGDFVVAPMAGLSINFGSTHNTYRNLPSYFPNDYYFQNKIHFAPFVGAMVYHPLPYKIIKGIDFYTEIGTIDNYLLEGIRTEYVKLYDIWNLALGISIHF